MLQAEYEAKQLGEMSDKKALISHMFEEMIGEVRPAAGSLLGNEPLRATARLRRAYELVRIPSL